MTKRLYRSKDNKIIGGMGEYFDIDPTILRLIFLAFLFATAVIPGTLFYLIALLIVPKKPENANSL